MPRNGKPDFFCALREPGPIAPSSEPERRETGTPLMKPFVLPNARAEPVFRIACRNGTRDGSFLDGVPRRAVRAKKDYGAALVLVTYSRVR